MDNSFLESTAGQCDTESQPSAYKQFPLADAGNQIRICSIQPGLVYSELRVSFRIINLDDSVDEYICLSYVWGDETKKYRISLNGYDHSIHHNLHLQLLRLRANNVVLPVWCDALCINQPDLVERSKQVAIMDRIYQGAAQVFVCVDNAGMDVLIQPPDEHAPTLQMALQRLANDEHLDTLTCFALDDEPRAINSPYDGVVASQFRRIVNASFFDRVWTVQEVVLAKQAVVIGEWGVFPWSLMVKALNRYNHHRNKCCISFVDRLPEDVESGCYKVGVLTA